MILIISYGNSLRQDDGAGHLLAEQIEQTCRTLHLPARRIAVQQLVPELALDIAQSNIEAVIFADTRAVPLYETNPQVQVEPLATHSFSPSVGHHLLPEVVLFYAYRLYDQQPPAWLVTVPGVCFDHSETLSQVSQQALATAPDKICELLTAQVAATVVG